MSDRLDLVAVFPETGRICLIRSVVVRTLLTGGVESAAYNSYTRRLFGHVLLLPLLHRSSFDLRSFGQHFVVSPKVDIGGRDVVERLVVALVVVVGEQAKLASKVPKSRIQLPWKGLATSMFDQ